VNASPNPSLHGTPPSPVIEATWRQAGAGELDAVGRHALYLEESSMRVKGVVTIALLLAATAAGGETPSPRTKEQAARELIAVTGADKLGMQAIDQMIPGLKRAIPDLDDAFWSEFRSSINPQELVDLAIPAYTSHFTLEELDGLIAFYKTKLGQKVVSTMPAVLRESMSAGQAWGEQLGKKAWERAQQYKRRPTEKS
jgi:hypothetical protein